MKGAKSIIILAKNYYNCDDKGDGAYVAKYARFRDYHKLIEKSLKQFKKDLQTQIPNSTLKSYVDYGPVLEKGFALKSGIGFIRIKKRLAD